MRLLLFIPFILFALSIIGGSHYILYWSLLNFFPRINTPTIQKLLLSALIILGTSFIFSSALVHWYENIATRFLYLLSSLWLGLFSNLFIASLILLFIFALLGILKISAPWFPGFSLVIYLIAIIFSVFGYLTASTPQIKSIEIKISNLPKSWQNKKIAQLSDVHLGTINREDFLEKLVILINKEGVDLVVLTGDFFDGMDGRLEHLAEPLNRLQADQGIYFITGNHETYLGIEKTVSALQKQAKAAYLNDQMINLSGLNIIGLGYPEVGRSKNLTDIINELNPIGPTILLYHEPRQIPEVATTGKIDLMLSGHTHNGQLWPYNYIVNLIYGPYAYGLNIIDRLTAYTTTGAGTWGPPLRIGARPEIPIFILKNK